MRTGRVLMVVTVALFAIVLVGCGAPEKGSGAEIAEERKDVRVVFEINDPGGQDNNKWTSVLGNIENSLNDIGDEEMLSEAVVHGEAIDLLHRENYPEEIQDKIRDLQERGVVFAACNNTMEKRGYTIEDMMDGSIEVPAGVGEVILKQQDGWAYMHP